MSDGEIIAALVSGCITALAITIGIPVARWFGAKRRERLAAAENARVDALIEAAYARVKELKAGPKSR